MDPVVSSRFGARPLLDIPAMQVSSTSHQVVPSLQKHNPLMPGEVIPRPYHTAPPGDHPYYDPFNHQHQHHPPQQHQHQPEYDRLTHYHGPRGEAVRPIPYCLPPQEKYPGVHMPYETYAPPPPQPPHPPQEQDPLKYLQQHQQSLQSQLPLPMPPMSAPQPQGYHSAPMPLPPHPSYPTRPAPPHPQPHPHYDSRPQTFDVTCELDYGRVAHISVRESHGHFRGIPDYLRRELMKTYGKYPFMEVKARYENGDYHIFANHDRKRNNRRDDYDRGRDRDRRRRDRDLDEEEEYYDERNDRRPADDEQTMTDGIRPRPMGHPRGILREEGWNYSYR